MAQDADAIARLREWVAESDCVVPFTGAGISTESGVPDFRSPGSPWLANKPIPFEAFVASDAVRREAWRRKFRMDESFAGARPNRGHDVLAEWVSIGLTPAIITQNIDGLHQDSGVPTEKIIELHGNGTYATCLDCGLRHELATIRLIFEATDQPPNCVDCSGIVKSATVSFGQAMPEAAMHRAQQLATECDLFLVLGSSLVVYPAAYLPEIAKACGARLVIVNRDPTPLDEIADLVLRGSVGAILAALGADRGGN